MMNNEMMRQLQARIQKMQEDLGNQTVEASAGGGAVTMPISEIVTVTAPPPADASRSVPKRSIPRTSKPWKT